MRARIGSLVLVGALAAMVVWSGGAPASAAPLDAAGATTPCGRDPNAAIRRLYLAYFGREPDTGGLEFWVDRCINHGGTLATVSGALAHSPEFADRYGALDDARFVTLVYRNVLDREPDAGGLQGWLDRLHHGATRGDVMIGFSESAEFVARTSPRPPERALADRPDDVVGPQVHVLYVVPSDGADRALDTNGILAASVKQFEDWLRGETGGSDFRLDTAGGEPDITFVRLDRTDAQLEAHGPEAGEAIQNRLRAMGIRSANKLYLIYIEGAAPGMCGVAPTPGQVAVVSLHPEDSRYCQEDLVAPATTVGHLEAVAVHELIHAQGFVAPCAPHHTADDHVNDDARDVMWSVDQGPWLVSALHLDVGHDDYYHHGIPGCPDLARSAFFDPMPADAVLPPGWGHFGYADAPTYATQTA